MNIHPIKLDTYVLLACLSLPSFSISNNLTSAAETIHPHLDANQVLLSYDLGTTANIAKISIIQKDKKLVEVKASIADDFSEKVKDFYDLVQQFSIIKKSNRAKFIQQSYSLYQQLIVPVSDYIEDADQLIILNKGVLQYLPFEVLLPTNQVNAFSKMDFLIKQYAISYFTSTSEFIQSKQYKLVAQDMLAFAPVFQQYDGNIGKNRSDGSSPVSFEEIKALPYSAIEAKELSQLFEYSTGQKANLLLHEQANKTAFLTNTKKSFRFIHLATHSFADFNDAEKSGIVCAGGEEECAPVYEVLFAKELENRKIDAELVVLSSCESGVGKLDEQEGVMGIHRSFMKAGCGNVLFSLWNVNDQVCQKFMNSFYRNIFSGKTYSESLQLAKLDLLKSDATASPNVWAAFLLMGV